MVTRFDFLLEMVASADFQKFKEFNLNTDTTDDKYDDITLIGNLKEYNTRQIQALEKYAREQLPGKSEGEINMFISRAIANPKTHRIMRQHVAFHNPELFAYINK